MDGLRSSSATEKLHAETSFQHAVSLNDKNAVCLRWAGEAYHQYARRILSDPNESVEAQARSSLETARSWYERILESDSAVDQDAAALADLILERHQPKWSVLKAIEVKSELGVTFETLEDDSIILRGDVPETDVYTVIAPSPSERVNLVRLEALSDVSFPQNGPGAKTGNFHLTEFEVDVINPRQETRSSERVTFSDAFATFEQGGRKGNPWGAVVGSIDGDPTTGRWAIAGGTGKSHSAIYQLTESLSISHGDRLRCRLHFSDSEWKSTLLGRFRISVSESDMSTSMIDTWFETKKTSNPWIRLAAAHLLDGQTAQAKLALSRAVAQADNASQRRNMATQIVANSQVRDAILKNAPDDPFLLVAIAEQYRNNGKLELASETIDRARGLFREALVNDPDNEVIAGGLADLIFEQHKDDPRWNILVPQEAESEGGATLTVLDDHSILAGGLNPDRDTYRVVYSIPQSRTLSHVRLEALTHETLPKNGPGRLDIGRFRLNAFDIKVQPPTSETPSSKITFNRAWWTHHHQGRFPVSASGHWNIYGAQGQDQFAIWSLSAPAVVEAGTQLICELTCAGNPRLPGENLGRFRVSILESHPTGQQDVWNAAMQAKPSWEKLGWCFVLEGDAEAGAAALARAISRETDTAARLNLIELIKEQEEVWTALQKILPDEPAVKAIRLRQQAEQFVAEDQVAQALKCYEQIAELPGYDLDLAATKELYARTMQWERALDGFEKTNDFRLAFMLYQVGRYDDYHEEVRKRLANYKEFDGDWRINSYLVLALLQPVTDDLHEAVHELALENVEKNDWLAGQAMYRLGRFTQWYAELSEDSHVRKNQDPFVVVIDRFTNDPSEDHRRLLEQSINQLQARANQQLRDGQLDKNWRGYIIRLSFIREAKRVLNESSKAAEDEGKPKK
ncbi:tetratricopeptide repeat protein [Gimesia panareensis]|uniref:tetratricopeptide repeat protein n=1 Tax=Gimesia panareensis TaxID=2527978 RepID=UPI00118A09E3|nr:hypothetical protein [Gimesia panareensis]QDU49629.1 hypothetical protein Pan110_19670 [Gimesia panareensis]